MLTSVKILYLDRLLNVPEIALGKFKGGNTASLISVRIPYPIISDNSPARDHLQIHTAPRARKPKDLVFPSAKNSQRIIRVSKRENRRNEETRAG